MAAGCRAPFGDVPNNPEGVEKFMKSIKKVLVLLAIVMTIIGLDFSSLQSKALAMQEVPRSTWLWNTSLIKTQPDVILLFLQQKGVKQVYLQVDQSMPISYYQSFIGKASANNIQVHALDGAPDWASAAGITKMDTFLNWLQNYQRQTSSSQRFAGIHLDVEPYLYKGWTSNYKGTVLDYQTALTKAKNFAKQQGIVIGADIPFWFDEQSYSNKYGKGSLAKWVIQNTDIPTVMAYRDLAEGSNGIIALIKNEMQIASTLGKTIAIGVETGQTTEGSQVTFYEEGEAIMNTELGKVQNAYSGSNYLFAIHHYQSWADIKQ